MNVKKQGRGRPSGSNSFIELPFSALADMVERGLIGANTPIKVSRLQFENFVTVSTKPLQGKSVLTVGEAESSTIQFSVS